MAWQPITIDEHQIARFIAQATAFERGLDDEGRALWRRILWRASGDGESDEIDSSRLLRGIWPPDSIIAPRYSGAMPNEGGGTTD